jgi:predicted RNA-binding protein Jag
MSTATIKKTPVEAKWDIKKVQEAAARVFAVNNVAIMSILAKQGDHAIKEFQDTVHKFQIEHFKTLGVKTPMDLAKAKAEFEANVFGSKIDIEGDDNNAKIVYNQCAMWDAMQKVGHLTPEQQEKAGKNFQQCVQNLAKEMGFKAQVDMSDNSCAITYTK